MKFSLARTALVLAAALSLASCGGGKATFPIHVTVSGLTETGLILSTNGMDVPVTPPTAPSTTTTFTFPNEIEYGETYDVIPKGQSVASDGTAIAGAQPLHQTCSPSTTYPNNLLPNGTAGQLATIQVYYDCVINSYTLGGTVTGLTADGLVLTNGSNTSTGTGITVASGATTFTMDAVPYNTTFGVSVLTQPTGLTCTVAGGNGPASNGTGIMDAAAAAAGGVTNLVVNCVPNPGT